MKIDVAGETLELFAERAALWRAKHTLLVADAHFGKAAAFRSHGVYVPEATTSAMLDRLTTLVERTRAQRIVFLGDFLHAREGVKPDVVRAVEDWRARHAALDMVLVRGNHDKRAGDPPAHLRIDCCEDPRLETPFALTHHPRDIEGYYVLAGHIHPSVVLVGAARQRDRLPCFWFGKMRAVLPAFGEFTGDAEVAPEPGDRVCVIAEGEVVAAVSESTFRQGS